MGVFRYDRAAVEIELDDRILAHLKLAIAVKLRRHEAFLLLRLPAPHRASPLEVWISRGPMMFTQTGAAPIPVNAAWVAALLRTADDHGVMTVLSEREAALLLAGITTPADRRRGVHVAKHPRAVPPRRR